MGTPISGTAGSVVYMTGGTTVVGEITEWNLDLSMSPVEVSAFGDNWKRSIPSIRAASGSFSGNFAGDDTAQTSLRNAMLGGSAIALRLLATFRLPSQPTTEASRWKGLSGFPNYPGPGSRERAVGTA